MPPESSLFLTNPSRDACSIYFVLSDCSLFVGCYIGFVTAQGASPLKELLVQSDELPSVWPHPQGKVRGQALLPLYEKLPLAAVEDPDLYELLSLFDALRAGQARERELARKLLKERLQ